MTLFDFSIFGFNISINFYGLMYAVSFILGYFFLKKIKLLQIEPFDTLYYYIIFGVVLGGRLGYVFFYNFSYYMQHPLEIFAVWEGGMSFHGGLLGVISACILFHKIYKVPFLKITDAMATVFPIGLFFGRIGNYANKELLGKEYYGPLAISVGDKKFFPSPLLEAFLEGIVLLIIMIAIYYFFYKKKPQIHYGLLSSAFLVFYAIFRIFIEYFFRMPDAHIGYIFGHVSLGNILSIFMLLAGIGLFYLIMMQKNEKHHTKI